MKQKGGTEVAKKKARIKIQSRYTTPYLKSRIGRASALNVQLADLLCKALAIDGKPKPDGVAPRTWVMSHALYIAQEGSAASIKARAEKFGLPQPVKAAVAKPQINQPRPDPTHQAEGVDVRSDAFLFTFSWRKLRMQTIKRYGAVCMCCGATPSAGSPINVDHIKPRKLFPQLALDPENLQVLCHDCNHGKGNWDQTDWRPTVEHEVDPSVREFIRDIARSS